MRRSALPAAALAAISLLSASDPVPTPAAPDAEVQEILAREKLRADFEAILAALERPEGGDLLFENATDRFLMLGPGVIPFLLNELERQDVNTFHYAAYALGHLEGPGIADALRRSAERLGEEPDSKALQALRCWALYALAMHGAPDIVDLMLSGKEPAGRTPWMDNVPLLEMATTLSGRPAVLQLMERLDGLRKDPQREFDVHIALEALAVSREPEVPAKLASVLEDERALVRISALNGLGQAGDPAFVDRVLAHLDAAEMMERQAAADALFRLRPLGREKVLLAKLETETDAGVRSQLYQTLADVLGERALEAFVSHWGRPDPLDRVGIMRAADRLRSARAANLLRRGLTDKDVRVVTAALEGLSHLPGPGPADTLLALLRDPREPVARDAVRLLALRREPRAGGRVADLLLRELAGSGVRLSLGDRRDRMRVLGEALVDLRFTDVLEDLRRAASGEGDLEVEHYLLGVAARLEALQASGDDRAKWAALLKSDDPGLRRLARVRLGALGGDEAARALAAVFGRDVLEDRELLGELGRTGSPEAAPLLERVLVEPAFDPAMLRPLREGAAYGARLLGGARMLEALRRSAVRREGRDAMVVTYYALAAGKDAAPLLRELRTKSLTWYEWNRGKDLDRIDFLAQRLSAGLSVAALDLPPDYLTF